LTGVTWAAEAGRYVTDDDDDDDDVDIKTV